MNKTIYSQLDSRWSDKPYPTTNSSFGGNGCGPCAVTHVAIEQKAKANWTPNKLRKWMIEKGYAVSGQGTKWSGIEAALKYIGHERVVWIGRNDPMSDAWNELNRGNRMGVLLVDNSKTPDGTVWTASGHYVAFIKYKREEDGRHYFYIKDSGFRQHNGWYCYEKSLKGALPQMWIVEKLPTVQQKMVTWAKKIAADNSFKYVHYDKNDPKTRKCPICNNYPKGKYHGFYCTRWNYSVWKHGGGLPIKCIDAPNNGQIEKIYNAKTDAQALKLAKQIFKLKDIKVIRNKKGIPQDELKAGDSCYYFNGSTCQHAFLYIGGGKMIDANSLKDGIAVRKAMSCKVAIRYTGK